MRLRHALLVLPPLALAACGKDLSLPGPGIPQLTLTALTPDPAKGGDVITASFDVSADVLECEALIGPLWATCTIVPPRTCSCTAVVPDDITESIYAVTLSGRSLGGTGRAFEAIKVDQKPPRVVSSRVSFAQRSTSWSVSAVPAAVSDLVAGVKEIRLYGSASSTTALATLAPQADGSIPLQQFTSATPDELWVEAEDLVGHVFRARAGNVGVSADLAGRVRHTPSRLHLLPYFFAAEGDPLVDFPGYGAVVSGEAPSTEAAKAAAADLAASATVAPASLAAGAASEVATPVVTPVDSIDSNWSFLAAAAGAYDPIRRRFVLFGGQRGYCASPPCSQFSYPLRADTWEYDPDAGTWAIVATTGPAPRQYPGMAWDPSRGRVVVFGGHWSDSGSMVRFNDTWEWHGEAATPAWVQVPTTGNPTERGFHRMAFDAARGHLLAHGGTDGTTNCDGGFGDFCTGTWSLEDGAWRMLTQRAPTPSRFGGTFAWSTRSGELILFGGVNGQTKYSQVYPESWVYQGTDWTRLLAGGTAPTINIVDFSPPGAFDAARGVLQVAANGGFYELAPASPGTAPAWSLVSTAVQYYDNRTMVFWDPVKMETVVFRWGEQRVLAPAKSPHARTAAHSFALDVTDGATLGSLTVTWVGAGSGGTGNGAKLYAWNWATKAWDLVGSNTAAESDPAAARTISAAPPNPAAQYLQGKRLWFMAVAPPSDVAGIVDSRIATDYAKLDVAYTLQ